MKLIPQERQPDASVTRPLIRDDTKFAAGKIAVFQYFAVGVFVFLAVGYWDLQVRNEEFYLEKAYQNQIKSLPIPAPRGKIIDRDGRVIVDNHSSYRLILSRDNLREEHVMPIATGLNLDPTDLAAKIRRFRRQPTYFTIPLKEELSADELTFVEAHKGADAFPEMELIKSQFRVYPGEGTAAHLLGYVGEINEAELNSQEWANHNPGDIIGKSGIERYYNEQLTGIDGQRQVRVDNRMNTREVLGITEAQPGKDLKLTIDLDLQVVAELAMQNKRGAVVAIDPRNGEILAFVSTPAPDPNHFVGHIDAKEWAALATDPYKPLFNRALAAQQAPGSTFKPIMALAALESGVIDENFTVNCAGGANWYGRWFTCHKKSGHGTMNLRSAIAQSCDVFFYAVGNKLGIDRIAEYAEMAGLGHRTGIDLPGEKEGTVPSTKWKIRTQREKWYAGETISVSIGQGALTVTPLQLAHAIGGIATGGVWMRPHVVKEENGKPEKVEPARKASLNIDNVNQVIAGMYAVVNQGGTGGMAAIPGVELCGKTGTAQLASNDLLKSRDMGEAFRDNGWFVGFAPRSAPEIVVAALYENGAHGDRASWVVRDIVKAYFDKKARLNKLQQPPPGLATLIAPVREIGR
ncbi:penicillin-binding protein 2 [uncultured Paludibaculum sp.]|uniref:penicillin-binding protein 2 n=1 Tax=uncultured Paludibaculum sp. TaxID=1765020 RepID=UPI002AAB25DB|nr:penicillin-binding protein 2 [uncultured Paludibaculum sp.]